MRHTPQPCPHVVMGLMFFPRGGSAQVTRALARELPQHGWGVTIVSSSVQVPGPGYPGDATAFFEGLDVQPLDCTAALAEDDPLRAAAPLHPSYEDRLGAPDRVFAAVDDATYEHLTDVWARVLSDAGAADAEVLHLHHLTPLHAAASRVAPQVPIVGHLHGTELLMLDTIAQGAPAGWTHADAWAERMRVWAATCRLLVVPSTSLIPRAQTLLGVAPERCIQLPNGLDPQQFDRLVVDRQRLWHATLVEHPRGWQPGHDPGSVTYTSGEAGTLAEAVVLVYVGRFTALKRLDLLLRSFARAYPDFTTPAALVLVGGFPGEWEGEHPYATIKRLGMKDVFLAGWHEQAELPPLYAAADALVLASAQEPFGQVLVEGMACGLPAVAAAAEGPAEIITDGCTGWLVPPDDEAALAAALVAAVNDTRERRTRGDAAYATARARYAWPALGGRLADLYAQVLADSR